MATPIRQILSSKLSSPLSPLYATKTPITKKFDSPRVGNQLLNRNNVRLSLFPKTPENVFNKKELRHDKLNINLCENIAGNSAIQINITDCSKNILPLSTPNKEELLINGTAKQKNLKILGQGSFGVVVEGIEKGKQVAVKICRKDKIKISFFREANALKLNHENVVKLYNLIYKDEANYGLIVMEYINSKNLQTIVEDTSIDLNDKIIVKCALHICEGLKHCHQNNIVHLDIKPSNILVCADYLCKICDFGNSINLLDKKQQNDFWINCGTVAYTAPELLLGKLPTCKSDIYSFGILLWQIKHRQIPYANLKNFEVIVYKVIKMNYRPDVDITETQDKYSRIYSTCWSHNLSSRPNLNKIIDLLKEMY